MAARGEAATANEPNLPLPVRLRDAAPGERPPDGPLPGRPCPAVGHGDRRGAAPRPRRLPRDDRGQDGGRAGARGGPRAGRSANRPRGAGPLRGLRRGRPASLAVRAGARRCRPGRRRAGEGLVLLLPRAAGGGAADRLGRLSVRGREVLNLLAACGCGPLTLGGGGGRARTASAGGVWASSGPRRTG